MTSKDAKRNKGQSREIGKTEIAENVLGETGSRIKAVTEEIRDSSSLKSEKLAYILEMLKELHKISTTIDEPMVLYLIEMAILEASTVHSMLETGMETGASGENTDD